MSFGGQNKAYFYRVKKNEALTAYELRQINGTTIADLYSEYSLLLDKTVQTDFQVDASGLPQISWDQDVDSAAYLAFLKAVCGASGGGNVAERVYENGVKAYGESGTSTELVLVVVYGQEGDELDTTGKLKVKAGLVTIPLTSYSDIQSATATNAPKITAAGIKAEFDLEISSVLSSALITVPASMKIEAGEAFNIEWIAKAA
ncbi:MAG TPA: hypothetical protein DCS19_04155 [Flavobacterium sp.]|nr:hypothetical protein [Flavobacterium sp.]